MELMAGFAMDPGRSLLEEVLQFEPELRVELRQHLGLGPSLTSERLENLLQETYARVLSVATESALTVGCLKEFAFKVLRQVIDGSSEPVIYAAGGESQSNMVPTTGNRVPNVHPIHISYGTNDAPLSEADLADLVRAVQRLPDLTRRVFTLRKVYGWSQQTISEQTGLSAEEVAHHLVDAARACARCLFDPAPARKRRFGRQHQKRH